MRFAVSSRRSNPATPGVRRGARPGSTSAAVCLRRGWAGGWWPSSTSASPDRPASRARRWPGRKASPGVESTPTTGGCPSTAQRWTSIWRRRPTRGQPSMESSPRPRCSRCAKHPSRRSSSGRRCLPFTNLIARGSAKPRSTTLTRSLRWVTPTSTPPGSGRSARRSEKSRAAGRRSSP